MPYIQTDIKCGVCDAPNNVRIGGQTETPDDASPIKLCMSGSTPWLYLHCRKCLTKVRLPFQKIEEIST